MLYFGEKLCINAQCWDTPHLEDTLHWQPVINSPQLFIEKGGPCNFSVSSLTAPTQTIVTLENMDFWISIPFILHLHPFPTSAIRVFSTSTDYQGWTRGGSNHTEQGWQSSQAEEGVWKDPLARCPHQSCQVSLYCEGDFCIFWGRSDCEGGRPPAWPSPHGFLLDI